MLFSSVATDRMGKTSDGTAVCDFEPEEIKRKCSVSAAVAPVEWKNVKFNMIDVPGLFDFEGAVAEGFRAADCALITISGKSGVAVGSEKAYAVPGGIDCKTGQKDALRFGRENIKDFTVFDGMLYAGQDFDGWLAFEVPVGTRSVHVDFHTGCPDEECLSFDCQL